MQRSDTPEETLAMIERLAGNIQTACLRDGAIKMSYAYSPFKTIVQDWLAPIVEGRPGIDEARRQELKALDKIGSKLTLDQLPKALFVAVDAEVAQALESQDRLKAERNPGAARRA